jgi:hypothetical protein
MAFTFLMRDTLAVFSSGLGEGLEPTLQGVAAFLVDESHTARMFTIIASLESAGRLVGGPLMTWLFFADYDGANKLFGFCFMGSSVCSLFWSADKPLTISQILFATIAALFSFIKL